MDALTALNLAREGHQVLVTASLGRVQAALALSPEDSPSVLYVPEHHAEITGEQVDERLVDAIEQCLHDPRLEQPGANPDGHHPGRMVDPLISLARPAV